MNLPVEMLKCLQFQEINSGLLGKYRSSGWLFFFFNHHYYFILFGKAFVNI